MLLEKIAVSKGKSIFFTRERKFFRGENRWELFAFS